MNDWLTTGDVARLCQIPYITAYNWVKSGKIKAQRTPGGHYRIKRGDLVEFLEGYGFPIDNEVKRWRKKRILIVSEKPEPLVEMLKLADGSYDTAIAENGFAAAFNVMSFSPDLVLLDSLIPDGLSICQQIKTNTSAGSVQALNWQRINLVVTVSSSENLIRFLQAGAEDCLLEPITQQELLNSVQSLLS